MAKEKKAAPEAKKEEKAAVESQTAETAEQNKPNTETQMPVENTVQESSTPQDIFIATVDLPPQYTDLNIREEPNGKIVGTLKNGATITFYGSIGLDNGETWAQISDKQFVNIAFLKIE